MCVCVWVSSVGVQQKTEGEKEKLASKGRAVLCGCMVTHLPLQGPLGARRRGRFTAGWLLRNEPREASQRRARGISTIINNPGLREKEHQLSSCSHASEAHCRKIFAVCRDSFLCSVLGNTRIIILSDFLWFYREGKLWIHAYMHAYAQCTFHRTNVIPLTLYICSSVKKNPTLIINRNNPKTLCSQTITQSPAASHCTVVYTE